MAKPAFGFAKTKREGEDIEAINRLFAPEFRNRLDSVVQFGHLPVEVIRQVVDKFIAQLEAQLADRHVTIALTDPARNWLVENGYDEQMGARPMARLIQTAIKTPLADEVLFGRLKGGGHVRVITREEDGKAVLGFEFPEGPLKPKPEALPQPKKPRALPKAAKRKALPPPKTPDDEPSRPRRSPVPKLPLKG
jgi:ATP-dependent Clp protease ATP-binding subunit ClpA